MKPDRIKKVKDCIKRLGTLKQLQIAILMVSLGINGRKGCPDRCPIKKYLYKTTKIRGITVGNFIQLNGIRILDTPKNVAKFIKKFDDGLYDEFLLERRRKS